jgi:hypothetical protein
MWGAIQDAVSPVDFDFWEWSMERFELASSQLPSPPDFDDLLRDVHVEDSAEGGGTARPRTPK